MSQTAQITTTASSCSSCSANSASSPETLMTSLNNHVLVLNKSWLVIGTTSVKNSLTLISRGSAQGLCTVSFNLYNWENWVESENPPQVNDYILSTSGQVPAPEAIVLTRYNDIFAKEISFSNKAIYKRDNYICQYCHKRKPEKELSLDHVIPKSRGGKANFENVVTACQSCNNSKADRTPEEFGVKLRMPLGRPKWNPIFHVPEHKKLKSWNKFLKQED